MLKNKAFSFFAVAAVAGLAACGGADDRTVVQDTAVMQVPTVDTVQQPVQVPTTDTIGVERTVEVEHDTVIDTRP